MGQGGEYLLDVFDSLFSFSPFNPALMKVFSFSNVLTGISTTLSHERPYDLSNTAVINNTNNGSMCQIAPELCYCAC